ncbi:protein of unknown function [Ralstonia solanacearum CFBP2957]|nr:protein of unknown function [Ralstonia solanacearum CFBP2957]
MKLSSKKVRMAIGSPPSTIRPAAQTRAQSARRFIARQFDCSAGQTEARSSVVQPATSAQVAGCRLPPSVALGAGGVSTRGGGPLVQAASKAAASAAARPPHPVRRAVLLYTWVIAAVMRVPLPATGRCAWLQCLHRAFRRRS